jgi:hypothetical protein
MAMTIANSFTLSGNIAFFFHNTNDAGHQFYSYDGESVNVYSRFTDSGSDMTFRKFYKASGYNTFVSKRMVCDGNFNWGIVGFYSSTSKSICLYLDNLDAYFFKMETQTGDISVLKQLSKLIIY